METHRRQFFKFYERGEVGEGEFSTPFFSAAIVLANCYKAFF